MSNVTNTLPTAVITDVELTYARVGTSQYAFGKKQWNVKVTAQPGTEAHATLAKFKGAGAAVHEDGEALTVNIKQVDTGSSYIQVFDENGYEMSMEDRNRVGDGSRGDVVFAFSPNKYGRMSMYLREVKVNEVKTFTPVRSSVLGAGSAPVTDMTDAQAALMAEFSK